MAGENISPNMGMPIPGVAVTDGPQWAADLDNCLTIVDGHTHTPGSGVQLTPASLNINSDLPFNGNNAITLRSVRFSPQVLPLSLPADIGSLYESGVDLFYNDGNGNQIQLTRAGAVTGTPGSISNLLPPASVTFVAGTATFVFQSAANTPANIDGASFVLRNLTIGSAGLTLSPPNAMGSDFSIVLPSLPSAQAIVEMDVSGNMTASPSAFLALPMPGAVILYAGSSQPSGWLFCNGSAVSRATYANLFAAIGTTYGPGDGVTTFNLPNTQNNVPMGAGGSYTLGSIGGEAAHVLSVSEMPNHTHSNGAHTHSGTTGTELGTSGILNISPSFGPNAGGGTQGSFGNHTHNLMINPASITIDATGGGLGHNNIQPFLAFNYIIKT